MAQYAYLLRPCRPSLPFDATPEEQAVIGEHFAYLQRHHAAGQIAFVGRCEDGEFGIVVYDAPGEAEAAAIMRGDPAVEAGLMTATLHPFRVVLQGVAAQPAGAS